ncbi:MAG: SprT family zinc-dependent metalloprotease [Steroidobacteraceae bacterium]
MRVYPGGRVEVVVPQGASPITVQRFVGTHRRWILDRVGELSTTDASSLSPPSELALPAIGRTVPIEYQSRGSGAPRVGLDARGTLRVAGDVSNQKLVTQALREWLMSFAREMLGAELMQVAAETGFTYRRVQIRRQRTRWGSCSISGTISLNVCLVFLRPDIVRYLLIHELCHTRHMNHSARYWALVATHEPNFRQLDRELLRGWRHVPAWMFA